MEDKKISGIEVIETVLAEDEDYGIVVDTNAQLEVFEDGNIPEDISKDLLRRMAFTVYVNKTSSNVTVYQSNSLSSTVIGRITPNEVYVVYGGAGYWYSIRFINSSGVFTSGYIYDNTLPNAFFTYLTDYPYGRYSTSGYNYYTFRLRRSANVKNPSGTNIATLASGVLVCTLNNTVGQTYNDYKHIWGYVSGSTYYDYPSGAFVDMGITYGPFGSSMTMYGTF